MKRTLKQIATSSAEKNKAYELMEKAKELYKQGIKDDVLDLQAFKTIIQRVKMITGQKRKGLYYTSLEKMKESDFKLLNRQLERFIESPQATTQGREEIYKKAVKTFSLNYGFDKNLALSIMETFQTDAYYKLLEMGIISSDQVVKMYSTGGSETQVENALIKFGKWVSNYKGKTDLKSAKGTLLIEKKLLEFMGVNND